MNNLHIVNTHIPNFRVACSRVFNARYNYKEDSCLWRSGNLLRISEPIANILSDELNIQCHIDLRSCEEIKQNGIPKYLTEAGIQWKSFPLSQVEYKLRTIKFPTFNDYFEYYFGLITTNNTMITEIIKYIILTPFKRYLFSCHAGKDRTGVIILLIMYILKVNNKEIFYDYKLSKEKLLSQIDFFQENWMAKNITKEDYSKRFCCDLRAIKLLFNKIKSEFGSIEKFFLYVGINEIEQNKMKEKFYTYVR